MPTRRWLTTAIYPRDSLTDCYPPLVLLTYVIITVPLRLAFDVETDYGTISFWFDVLVDIYFLCDIVINFRTAYYDSSQVLVIKPDRISWHYLTSWFAIDVISCMPISYINMIVEPEADSSWKD